MKTLQQIEALPNVFKATDNSIYIRQEYAVGRSYSRVTGHNVPPLPYVVFTGYSLIVVCQERGEAVPRAGFDFETGCATVVADDGFLITSDRLDMLKLLPETEDALKGQAAHEAPSEEEIELTGSG